MLKLWDKTSNIIQPNGVEYTPAQIMADPNFGFTKHVDTVVEQLGPITVAIDNLHILLQVYNLDENLRGQEALDAIIEAKERQRMESQEAVAEQILAAVKKTAKVTNEGATYDAIIEAMSNNR